MNQNLTVINERVDDIPLLLAQLKRMGVQELLDKHFPTHGNWQGLSLGWVTVIWLCHILSQKDHRLNQVQSWSEKRLETLRILSFESLRALDFSDDRLEGVLRYLSDDESWFSFEPELGGNLIQVYDLSPKRVRLDSTTASSYCGVDESGLFQWGHSKDHRPDLAQVKVMLSTVDPLALPVAIEVLAGHKADDPLYIPAISRVRETLATTGLLYIGDCKMAAMKTRAYLVASKDYYLCPLSSTHLAKEKLESYLEPVWAGTSELTSVEYTYSNGETKEIAVGYERAQPHTSIVDGVEVSWIERQLVVRSQAVAVSAEKSLRTRLDKAQGDLALLGQPCRGKKRLQSLIEWQEAASVIVARYRVSELLQLEYRETTKERQLRGYGNRPAQVVLQSSVELCVILNETVLAHQLKLLGWRVYVTNQPSEQLTLAQAVVAYREEYLIERGFGRLKGFPLSLTPMYLQRDDHIKGLIRLLSLGLRVLTLLDFHVHRSLNVSQEKLSGLYPGNPKRTTARPTAEKLLGAFGDITLVLIDINNHLIVHISPLSPLQQQILALLNFPIEIYTELTALMFKPP